MKSSTIFTLIFGLAVSFSMGQIINSNCEPEKLASIGVKTKTTYLNLESKQIMQVEDFQYDSVGRLQRKNRYVGNRKKIIEYDEYKYDDKGILVRKLNYVNNKYSGFILLRSKVYIYSDGLLMSEKESFPQANYSDEYRYEYNKGLLLTKTYYSRDSLINKTSYKYENGKLNNESLFDRWGKVFHSIDYLYNDNILAETRHFTASGELIKTITYNYSNAGRLEIEKLKINSIYSSEMPHIVRYGY